MMLRRIVFGTVALTLLAALCFMSVCLTGCYTSITAKEVTENSNACGLRYYLPTPYLIVRHLPNDTWDAELQVFADRSRIFSAQPNAYFAKSDFTLTYNADGTIKEFSLTQDSTAVASASITGMKDIASKETELRQEMYDRQIQKAQNPPSGASMTVAERNTSHQELDDASRGVLIYRILADKIERAYADPSVSVEVGAPIVVSKYLNSQIKVSGTWIDDIRWDGPISVELRDKDIILITLISERQQWTACNRKYFQFFDKNGALINPSRTAVLRSKLAFEAETSLFTVKIEDLKGGGVKRVLYNEQ